MKTGFGILLLAVSFILLSALPRSSEAFQAVPLAGNSFLTKSTGSGSEKVTGKGWEGWKSPEACFSTFIYITQPGNLHLVFKGPANTANSTLDCRIGALQKTITVHKGDSLTDAGEWQIGSPGYVRIELQGLKREGPEFALFNSLQVSGTAVNSSTSFVKNNEGNYFYWGRRGPSVHLNYDTKEIKGDIQWFYNEIVVPEGNDVIGSYFMANGFGEGYFGIQVNSDKERRILFSVWSPFKTDDPKSIPENQKILLLRKGPDVHTGEFGNEGSGGQSYLTYNWKAGTAYRFLLKGEPVENNYTNYTAWFYAPEEGQWRLIASFSRPATHTYLTRLHSFLENFIPETGYLERKAWYQRQWVYTSGKQWFPVTAASFTYDATARKGYRLDYNGSADGGHFQLRNCGFFNDSTALRTVLKHDAGIVPDVDFTSLDK